MMYDYRTVPFMATNRPGTKQAWQETADQLRQLILNAQREGWEFVSIEHVSSYEPPGCIAGLFGAGPIFRQVDLVLFRRPWA
jgi:hypothetical protein